MQSVGILGTGMAVPDKILTNFDLEKMVDTSDEWIRTRSGISERHIAESHEHNSDFAAKAGQMAIQNAGINPESIDLIILATVSAEKIFPATANIIQNKIGAKNAFSFDLNAACSGFIFSMITAESFIASGTCKNALVIGSEIMSRLVNWQDRSTCVLFGDGAGAVVLGPIEGGRGILSRFMKSNGQLANLLHLPAGGTYLPPCYETIDKKLHFIKMSGNEVFKHAVKCMVDGATNSLAKAGLTHEDLKLMIPHQANYRIIEATAKRINLPMEKVLVNIHDYGNTTAASIPIGLHEAIDSGRLKQGDNVLLVTFGAGFTWSSVVIRI